MSQEPIKQIMIEQALPDGTTRSTHHEGRRIWMEVDGQFVVVKEGGHAEGFHDVIAIYHLPVSSRMREVEDA